MDAIEEAKRLLEELEEEARQIEQQLIAHRGAVQALQMLITRLQEGQNGRKDNE